MKLRCPRIVLIALTLAAWQQAAGADLLNLPNASFELPTTTFVSTVINGWQKTPKPADYDESGGFLWTQLTGIFMNTPVGATDHLDNCDAANAVWLFNVPKAGFFQDYNSFGGNDTSTSHQFNEIYKPGKAYVLTVGVNGGGGNMPAGATLLIALYYRDGGNNMVTVASTTVVNNLTNFPNHTHLTEYQVQLPVVKGTDAWCGQHVGVLFYSNVDPALQGGYWDLDNVRITALFPTVDCIVDGANVRIWWPSVTGHQYQVLAALGLGQTYSNYGTAQAGTGQFLSALYPYAGVPKAYFKVGVTP
jgi:hypothetical protein